MQLQMEKTGFRKKFIGNRAFYAMVLTVAVPIMIQNGISNFVSLLDNIMVGSIGTEQMSGVSICNQLNFIYFLCMFGGVGGVGIFTAQYYGNNDQEGIRRTFRFKIWMSAVLTLLAFLVFKVFGSTLIGLYLNESSDGGDLAATLQYALGYFDIIFLMYPAFLVLQVYASTLRESGETKVPMIAGVVAVFVNLILNYLLIFGKFGLPKLGVNGAAIATVTARYVETLIVVIYTHTHKERFPYLKGLYRTLLVPAAQVKEFFMKSLPLLINETLWSVGMSVLLQCYSLRGLNVIVAFNIANTIANIFNIVFIAMGDAVAIIVGQKLGAGKIEEAKDTDNKIIFFSVAFSLVTAGLLAAVSGVFPLLYNTSAEARHLATLVILGYAIFQPLNAFNHAAYFTLRSGGKTWITFLFDSCFVMLLNVPVAFLLTRFTDLPIFAIFCIVSSEDLIKVAIGYTMVKKNVWINRLT